MVACRYGHEAVVKLLLGSDRVTAEHIGATDKVRKERDG
jgi:hypothetical protein